MENKINFTKFIGNIEKVKTCSGTNYVPNFIFNPKYGYEIDFDIKLSNGKNLQRGYVWSNEQKEAFIFSLLKEIHIPPFYVIQYKEEAGDKNAIFKIVDGKQRLSTIKDFMENKFSIFSSELQQSFYYKELDSETQRKVWNANLVFHIHYEYADDKLTDKQLVNWFDHINFSGTIQDINHIEDLKQSIT